MENETSIPAWLTARQEQAREAFAALPWPDESIEEWKHTSLNAFDAERYTPAAPVTTIDAEHGDGVRVFPLSSADPGFASEVLGRATVPDHEAKFATWNAGYSDPIVVHVPRGVAATTPVRIGPHIRHNGDVIFPHLIVLAEEGSQVTVVDGYADPPTTRGDAACVANIEIHAEQGAIVNYISVQDHPQTVFHFALLQAFVGRDATVRTLVASIGARLSRTVNRAILDGQAAHAELLGVSFGDHQQHIDNRTLQLHRAPHTTSELYYKGALKGHARSVYSGLVDLDKDALQSDAQQANRNLMLSDHAHADATPFLEIKTSEVARATHAVSVGRPDKDVLFYLLSRGLDASNAERLFVQGFFQEIIDRVRDETVARTLEAAVEFELDLEDEA